MKVSRTDQQDDHHLSPAILNGDYDVLPHHQQSPPHPGTSEPVYSNPDVEPSRHPDAHPLLPRSSGDLWLDLSELDGLLSSYCTLRSFGFLLRLSPFTLKELCRDILLKNSSSSLLDEIHISVLRTLQLFPPIEDEGEGTLFQGDEASYNVKDAIFHLVNDSSWRFLDALTWPEFLRRWLIASGSNCNAGDFFNSEDYWLLSTSSKVNLLKSVCDDLLDSWIVRKEIQNREQDLDWHKKSERAEVAMKKRVAKATQSDGGDSEQSIPEHYDHLYKRAGLDDLELDVCDVTGVGGTLMCCDGCPASYLGRSVGVKRIVDDKQAWFCEECRIGGQFRSHRFLHRAPSALEWCDQPPMADMGQGFAGLRCFTAHGRVFVGNGKELYAYYSTVEKVDSLVAFLDSVANDSSGEQPSPRAVLSESADFPASPDLDEEDSAQPSRKRPRYSEYSSDEEGGSDDELPINASYVFKRKKKALFEQMAFRAVVEAKQFAAKEYVNKYKDAQSLTDVFAILNKQKDKQERKKGEKERKWNNWPRSNDAFCIGRPGLGSVSSYLLQLERTLFGLVDGPFLQQTGRREWMELVEQADDVSELAKAALTLEASIRPIALLAMWFSSADKKGQGKGRPKAKKDGKKECKEQEVDWKELRDAGVFEDGDLPSAPPEEDDIPRYLVWVSGRKVLPLGINLSRKSLRHVVLTAGEAEVTSMTYKGITATPSARLVWIRATHEAKTTAQLAVQLRVLDEAIRADISRKPVPPADLMAVSNVVERVTGKRELARGHTEYEVQMFGDEARREWMPQEAVPLYCIREFEQDARRASDFEAKKVWWRDFDFHPGAAVEVECDGQWFEGYIVECFDTQPPDDADCGGLDWRDGIGIVRVHYIGGLDEEDEWLYKDDERLREDMKTEARMLKDRARRIREELKANKIADKGLRMQARLALYQERLMLREKEALLRSTRDLDKARDKERREQEKLERGRQRERERLGRLREKESEREARILERRQEQEKKDESKKIKKAARERQRMEHSADWWKDFNWSIGVMVEMEWEGEWWEAIVIKVLPPSPPPALPAIPVAQNQADKSEDSTLPAPDNHVAFNSDDNPLCCSTAQEQMDLGLVGSSGEQVIAASESCLGVLSLDAGTDGVTSVGSHSANHVDMDSVQEASIRPCSDPSLELGLGMQVDGESRDSIVNDQDHNGAQQHLKQSQHLTQTAGESQMASERSAEASTDLEAWEANLANQVSRCQGPKIYYPKDWPQDGQLDCNEDDRILDIARKYRVNADRLVKLNKKKYPGLTRNSLLKSGTVLDLPLPLDIGIAEEPPPPPDPWGIGIVLIHYVGGGEDETEWVFRCSKRMRQSTDKTWDAVGVDGGDEAGGAGAVDAGSRVGMGDAGAWRKHCARVLKRVRKSDKSWPFWEPVDPVKEGLDDYLDVIQRPMCLDIVESNLNNNKYSTPQEFAQDMRLTFNNAKVYNPPDHRYHLMADKMLSLFEDMWAAGNPDNNWGQAPSASSATALKEGAAGVATPPVASKKAKRASGVMPDSAKKGEGAPGDAAKADGVKGAAKRKGAGVEEAVKEGEGAGQAHKDVEADAGKPVPFIKQRFTKASRVLIKGLVDTLMLHELAKPFLAPVNADDVPDYYTIIKKPMDLGTLKDMLATHKCNTPANFERNVRLIFDNSRTYNGEDDQVSKAAKALERMFERKWSKILEKLESDRASAAAETVDAEAGQAAEAVQPVAAAKRSSTEGHESVGRKRGRPSEKSRCDDEGEEGNPGATRRVAADKKRGDLADGSSPMPAGNATPQQGRPPKTPRSNAKPVHDDDGQDGEQSADQAAERRRGSHGGAKKGKQADPADAHGEETAAPSDAVSQCIEVLDMLLSARGGHFFAHPVDVEGLCLTDYHEIVTQPMDLGTIRDKLLSGAYKARRKGGRGEEGVMEGFAADLRRVFDNAMLYNPESDRVFKAAAALLNQFEATLVAASAPRPEQTAEDAAAGSKAVGRGGASGGRRPKWVSRCEEELTRIGEWPDACFFMEPVDAKALGLTDYHRVVKRPMDLGTIHAGLLDGSVANVAHFNQLVDLVFANAMLYNPEDDPVHIAAARLASWRAGLEMAPHAATDVVTGGTTGKTPTRSEADEAAEVHPVGTMVKMLFADGVWYEGTIQRYSARLGRYTIVFPDGDVQTTKLPDPEVIVLSDPPPPAASRAARKASSATEALPPATKGVSSKNDVAVPRSGRTPAAKDAGAATTAAALTPDAGGAKVQRRGRDGQSNHASAGPEDGDACPQTPGLSPGRAGAKVDGASDKRAGQSAKRPKASDDSEESPAGPGRDVLNDCIKVLDMLLSARGGHFFAHPVDVEGLCLTDYHEIVTQPMDLGTIRDKLLSGAYKARRKGGRGGKHEEGVMEGFAADLRRVFDNAMLYNPESDRVFKAAASLRQLFDANWADPTPCPDPDPSPPAQGRQRGRGGDGVAGVEDKGARGAAGSAADREATGASTADSAKRRPTASPASARQGEAAADVRPLRGRGKAADEHEAGCGAAGEDSTPKRRSGGDAEPPEPRRGGRAAADEHEKPTADAPRRDSAPAHAPPEAHGVTPRSSRSGRGQVSSSPAEPRQADDLGPHLPDDSDPAGGGHRRRSTPAKGAPRRPA